MKLSRHWICCLLEFNADTPEFREGMVNGNAPIQVMKKSMDDGTEVMGRWR